MVTFNELRIDESKKHLVIDCAVEDIASYADVYIDTVDLVHYSNIDSNGLIIDDDKVYNVYTYETGEDAIKSDRWSVGTNVLTTLGVDADDFGLGLFYVIISCRNDGEEEIDSDEKDIAVVIDWEAVYSAGMPFVASIAAFGFDRCVGNLPFEEFIILWNALQMAIAVCDYSQIAMLWRKFLRFTSNGTTLPGGCPCNN